MELVNDFTVSASVSETWKTLTDLELIAPCMPGAQLTEVEGETYRGLVKIKVGPITAQFKGQANFVERDEDNHKAVLKADGRDTGGKGNASALITAQLVPVTDDSTKVTVTTDLTITGKVAQFGRGALADVSDKLLKQFVHNLETTVLSEAPGDDGQAPSATTVASDATAPGGTGTSTDDPPAAAGPTDAAPSSAAPADAAPLTAPPTTPAVSDRIPTDAGPAPAPGATEAPRVRHIESKPVEPIDLLETAGAPILKRLAPVLGGLLILLFILRRRRA